MENVRRACAAALLLCFAASSLAGELVGRVVAISDGDTIEVLDVSNVPVTVRLANIDAPETSCHQHSEALAEACIEASQPFGKASKRSLSALVFGKSVRVVLIEGKNATSYGRAVGTVYVDAIDANLEQVRRGYAWHYTAYGKRQQSPEEFDTYAEAERSARAAGAGLWADKSPAAPWDFRHQR